MADQQPGPQPPPPAAGATSFRNPDLHPLVKIEGGKPVRFYHRYSPILPTETDCVRHVYLLHQQPADSETDINANSLGERTPAPEPEILPPDRQTPEDVYISKDEAILDLLAPVHVLEFRTNEGMQHATLTDGINRLPSEMVPTKQLVDDISDDESPAPVPGPGWITGNGTRPTLSLLAIRNPRRFRLMVSIPHLTFGGNVATNPTLEEYRNSIAELRSHAFTHVGTSGDARNGPIFVHRSEFMVINSDMIVMARTASNEQSSPLPFFPYQHRVSALHLLVHMIGTALQFSSGDVLDNLRRTSWDLSDRVHIHVSEAPYYQDAVEALDVMKAHLTAGERLGIELASYISNLCAIQHLTQAQLQVLADLAEIISNNAPDVYDKGYNQNIIRLPFVLQKGKHNIILMDAIKMVIGERKEFEEQVKWLLEVAKQAQKSLLCDLEGLTNRLHARITLQITEKKSIVIHHVKELLSSGGTIARDDSRTIQGHLANLFKTQTEVQDTTKRHAEEAKMNARTMSMFTLVTTIFLPLTFFTSYFALNPGDKTVKSHADFWKIATVPTFAFAATTLYIILRKKYHSGEYDDDTRWFVRLLQKLHKRNP